MLDQAGLRARRGILSVILLIVHLTRNCGPIGLGWLLNRRGVRAQAIPRDPIPIEVRRRSGHDERAAADGRSAAVGIIAGKGQRAAALTITCFW